MPNNHDYDDLLASYERQSIRNRQHEQEKTDVDRKKSAGYTSSSSYSKAHKSSSAHSLNSLKEKALGTGRTKKARSPEKSQKTYYDSSAWQPSSKKRTKKSADTISQNTVKFNYNSTKREPQPQTQSNYQLNKAYVDATKDDYRKKYERLAKERSHNKPFAKKSTEKKEKRVGRTSFKNVLIFIICVLAASTVLSLVSISCVDDVLAINRHSDKAITITIDKQVNTKEVIKMLKKNDLIKNEIFCNLFAKFKGYSNNYETGVFYLKKDMGLEGMILALKATSQTEETITITFPEGYSVIDIANKLEANEVCKAKNFIDTLENYTFDYEFLPASLKADKRKYQYLEGYLFPSTYEFYIGESPSNVIKKMLDAFATTVYTDEFKSKADSLGMKTDEIITLASIIQREAANKEQMSQIASVLYNRLNDSDVFPRLECDSTTDFLSSDVKDYLKLYPDKGTIDYFALYYNTYNNSFSGLPAGAICNPGSDAINAVLNMQSSQYYYFCHDSSGEIHLAITLSEFEYIKNQYGINSESN